MSDYTEHLISMAGGDGDVLDATGRVSEWARQWRLNPNIDKSGTIYNVWFDPESSAIELNLNDIEALLALVREQQAKLDRVAKVALSLHDPRVIQHSFHIGSDPEHDAYKAQVAARIRAAITATEAGK